MGFLAFRATTLVALDSGEANGLCTSSRMAQNRLAFGPSRL